jgi:nitrate reductase NapD
MTELHISSLVVHGHPERRASVHAALAAFEDVEIHAADERGKFVVVIETTSEADLAERFTAISLLEGVLAAALVYHHVEPVREEA